jgi:signal transduction histidine kinase
MRNSWSDHVGVTWARGGPLALRPPSIGSLVRLPTDLASILWPAFWLTVGLTASFAYKHAADFSPMTSAGLPHPLFPSQAVILSVLLVTPARHWALYLAAYYAALVLEGMGWSDLPRWYLLVSNLANVAEPLVGALLLRRFISLPPHFSTLREVGVYVACVAAASAVGATWGATMRAVAGYSFWLSLRGWFLGDVLASLLLAPTILLCVQGGRRIIQPSTRRRSVEAVLLFLSLLVVGALVFGTRSQGPDTAPALLYLPAPLLVWAAVRFGPRGLMWALSLTTVLAIAGVVNGHGPFVEQPRPASIFNLQLFLLGIGVPLFCLAALVQERQRAQARLEQSEERYRTVVRNLPGAAVLLFGPDLRHVFADGPELARLGLDRASAEGKTLAEAFPADVADVMALRYQAALAGVDVSFDLAHAGRSYRAHALPIGDAETIAGMVVLQEVTDERRAAELAALEDARTAFFNNVSHELRTPLTLLLAPLQEVLAGPPERLAPEVREPLEVAQQNGVRLLQLVNTLLDLSRLEAGRERAVYTPVDLAAYTAELASTYRAAIERADLRLVVHCPRLPEPVYVDCEQWERIVLSLLSNALKFTFEGEIVVTLGMQGRQAVLAVHDTGVGIPAGEIPRVFEPFHRVPGAPARSHDGSGIGLTLVRELARLHGGTASATSVPGAGSTFSVAIPRGSAHLPASQIGLPADRARVSAAASYVDVYAEEVGRWPAAAPDPGAVVVAPPPAAALAPPADPARAAAGRAARLLVVDASADLRAYVARLLAGRGTVQTVGDGAAALKIARAWRPDLILMDVLMPGLDGFALLETVRADPRLRSASVVLLSAWADDETHTRGLRAGADDYLAKPFTVADLLARVDGQLWLARLRSEAWTAAERERLAFDLHDSVTQSVYSLTLLAEAMRRASARGQRGQADEYLSRLSETAQRTLREMRLLVSQLRPVALSELGLVKALEHRLDTVERRAGLAARLVTSGEIALPRPAEEAFYFIAQEALNNALKHADATTVVVSLRGRPGGTALVVADNGRGFDVERAGGAGGVGGGVGLVSIRERAAQVGASVEIGRRRRGGTQVTVRLRTDERSPSDVPSRPPDRTDSTIREGSAWTGRSAS